MSEKGNNSILLSVDVFKNIGWLPNNAHPEQAIYSAASLFAQTGRNLTTPFDYVSNCWIIGKQWRLSTDVALSVVWSGTTLLVHAYLQVIQYKP